MFTKINIETNPTPADVPARGFYVDMEYMYGDADGYATRTVGPFPADRHDLILEFLNVCQGMLDLYPHGKGGWDGYASVPKYSAYFDEDYKREDDDPDQDIRKYVGAETEYTPDDCGCIASMMSFDCYFHDGNGPDKYTVTFS